MKLVKGIYLPDNDDHFSHHLERGPLVDGKGTYQYKKFEAALAQTPPERRGLALDVGAHVGLWSRVMAMQFETVWAWEPFPHLIECWKKNVLAPNATLFEYALGEIAGSLPMLFVKGNSGNARVATAEEVKRGKHIHQMEARRIDGQTFPAKVDFLKIDVEGWELHVIRGGEGIIRRDKPIIVVEQKKGNAEVFGEPRTGALNALYGFGYELIWEISGDYCLKHPEADLHRV